jgi:hypothetical protein
LDWAAGERGEMGHRIGSRDGPEGESSPGREKGFSFYFHFTNYLKFGFNSVFEFKPGKRVSFKN